MQEVFEKIKERCMNEPKIGRQSLDAFLKIVNQVAEEYSHGHFGCNSNADRIRAQISTDEGLADFIDKLDPDGEGLCYCKGNNVHCRELTDKGEGPTGELCRQCLMDYLQADVEE